MSMHSRVEVAEWLTSAVPGFWIDVNWLWPEERFIPVRQTLAAMAANP